MKIVDIKATTIALPLEAPLRHASGAHWGRFIRTIVEVVTDETAPADLGGPIWVGEILPKVGAPGGTRREVVATRRCDVVAQGGITGNTYSRWQGRNRKYLPGVVLPPDGGSSVWIVPWEV